MAINKGKKTSNSFVQEPECSIIIDSFNDGVVRICSDCESPMDLVLLLVGTISKVICESDDPKRVHSIVNDSISETVKSILADSGSERDATEKQTKK